MRAEGPCVAPWATVPPFRGKRRGGAAFRPQGFAASFAADDQGLDKTMRGSPVRRSKLSSVSADLRPLAADGPLRLNVARKHPHNRPDSRRGSADGLPDSAHRRVTVVR